jgi:hypothetical protein
MKYAAESPVSLLIRSLTIGLFEATPDKNTMSTLAADFMETYKKRVNMDQKYLHYIT